jgi:hypothetical protein
MFNSLWDKLQGRWFLLPSKLAGSLTDPLDIGYDYLDNPQMIETTGINLIYFVRFVTFKKQI